MTDGLLVVTPERGLREQLAAMPGVTVARFTDFVVVLGSGAVPTVLLRGRPLEPGRRVFFRLWRESKATSVLVAKALDARGHVVLETEIVRSTYTNKALQALAFVQDGVPIPRTVFVAREALSAHIATVEEHLDYPVVVKSVTGRKGRDNHLVHSRAEVQAMLAETDSRVEFVVQEFVPNDGDVRVLVLGHDAACAYRRVRTTDDHRNNLVRGGVADPVALEAIPEIVDLAERCARITQREVCGVDVVVHRETGRPYVLEANPSPSVHHPPARETLLAYLAELARSER